MNRRTYRRAPALYATVVIVGLVGLLVGGCVGGGAAPARTDLAPATSAATSSAAAVVYNLGRDFSFTANPNGPWSYGYTRGTDLLHSAFAPDTATETTPTVTFWHPGTGQSGYYPYVAAHLGGTVTRDQTGSWAVRPDEVALEAGPTGQFAVIEFAVPRDGSYAIAADFAGLHRNLSTTDAHVLLNDASLFAADIEGYGGDPSLLPHQGSSPTASYHETRALRIGDVLMFAIGYGTNHTHFNDTTGLILTIREV